MATYRRCRCGVSAGFPSRFDGRAVKCPGCSREMPEAWAADLPDDEGGEDRGPTGSRTLEVMAALIMIAGGTFHVVVIGGLVMEAPTAKVRLPYAVWLLAGSWPFYVAVLLGVAGAGRGAAWVALATFLVAAGFGSVLAARYLAPELDPWEAISGHVAQMCLTGAVGGAVASLVVPRRPVTCGDGRR